MITERDQLLPDEAVERLCRVDLFKGLPEDELRSLVEVIKGITAGPGDHLFEEGDEDDRFFLVTEGAVEIVKAVPEVERRDWRCDGPGTCSGRWLS